MTIEKNLLTLEQMSHMLSGAWGYSYYWASLNTADVLIPVGYEPQLDYTKQTNERWVEFDSKRNHRYIDCVEHRILESVMCHGIELDVFDAEDPETKLGTISKESMLKASEIMFREYPEHMADLIGGGHDAITADVWFQCVVLGEVVYG